MSLQSRFSRRGNSLLIVLIVAVVVGAAAFFFQKRMEGVRARDEALSGAEDLRKQMAETLKMDSDDPAAIQAQIRKQGELMDQMGKQLKSAGEKTTGDDAKMMRASAKFYDSIAAHGRVMNALTQRAIASQTFDFAAIKTKADLGERRKLLEELMAESAKLLATIESARTTIRGLLVAEGLSQPKIDGFFAGFSQGFERQIPLHRRMRNADVVMAKAGLSALALMEAKWGKWKADADGALVFEDEKAGDALNIEVGKIQAAAEDQDQAQQEFARVMSQPRKR